ncbi:hypothetical protein ACFQ14_04695 [Pseudahrensia aquimaris]|uniref:Uncharacterized protein n=1 Tax=Pseudahrensia aquimaris TaxID=744461 RepID=A0ABW3FDQ7_9HYPH
MDIFTLTAAAAAVGLVIFVLILATGAKAHRGRSWLLSAGLSVAFLGWSLFAIASEGMFGFWTEHVRNAWGNQIWFDLLLAVGVALTFMMPKAKALGMNVTLWSLLVLATGCIGLTAMAARIFYLEGKSVSEKTNTRLHVQPGA